MFSNIEKERYCYRAAENMAEKAAQTHGIIRLINMNGNCSEELLDG